MNNNKKQSLLYRVKEFFLQAFYVTPPSVDDAKHDSSSNISNSAHSSHRLINTPRNNPRTLTSEQNYGLLNRPLIFDPALRQYGNAIKAGEPQFHSKAHAEIWYSSRLQVIHHILETIHDSPHSQSLVLRGSILLATWLKDKARNPGDVDWVVIPSSLGSMQPASTKITDGIIDLLRASNVGEEISIPDRPFATDEIWTYEKAPGLRIIVPWINLNKDFGGTVQMDFVFGEKLPSDPVLLEVEVGDHPPLGMLAATSEQSLAWKLLWLTTDCYASGKDLYDSVLLAEYTRIDLNLLKKTFKVSDEIEKWEGVSSFSKFNRTAMLNWEVEWDDFLKEYPGIACSPEQLKERLANALTHIWEQLDEVE